MGKDSAATAVRTKRLAAIDIGSNSIRLLVAEASPDGSYRVLDDEKQTTRLAQGLAAAGQLSAENMGQSIEALRRMKTIVAGHEVDRLEVIATSAVREAKNRQHFLDLAREQLGLKIDIIAPKDEGQLSFLSVSKHFDLKSMNAVIMDLGGGSAELVLAVKGVVEKIHSLPLGAVRLTESFIHSDPLSDEDYRRLRKHIRKCFRALLGDLGDVGELDFVPQLMIGAGGTFTALANIAMRMRGESYSTVAGYALNRAELRHILDNLRRLPLAGRRDTPGLNADRADIIVAGLVVIERMLKLLRVNRLQIHDQGVRDGLLLRMIGRVFRHDAAEEETAGDLGDRLAGVRQFAAACGFEEKHARHVADLALQIFRQLQGPFQLPAEDALILEAAALLHEVGNLINYEKHHRHSYHLILHGNLRGLSPKQRELVANVARYHRRSEPKKKHEHFARLTPEEQAAVRRLSAILRLADGLDRTHLQLIKTVHLRRYRDRLLVSVAADRLPDVDLWGAEEKGTLLQKTFGVKLHFAWQSKANGQANGRPRKKR